MSLLRFSFVAALIILSNPTWAQNDSKQIDGSDASAAPSKIVVITGNRFSYKLVQKWIDDYNKVAPSVQIIIESRGTSDPSKYDILAEAYIPGQEFLKHREYINVARYAILPVATSNSAFANRFTEKGLTTDLIKQIFFNDILVDKETLQNIDAPYAIYTRQQRAGVPVVFAKYFGYEQKDIKGTTIAGADEHLLKALLRDPNGVTYLPLTLIYDQQTRKPIEGLTILPVDLNDNGRLNDDEKFYGSVDDVIARLEKKEQREIKNIPIEYLHLSIDKETASREAVDFLKWVNDNGQAYLHEFGYFLPEEKHFDKEKFVEFASKRSR